MYWSEIRELPTDKGLSGADTIRYMYWKPASYFDQIMAMRAAITLGVIEEKIQPWIDSEEFGGYGITKLAKMWERKRVKKSEVESLKQYFEDCLEKGYILLENHGLVSCLKNAQR